MHGARGPQVRFLLEHQSQARRGMALRMYDYASRHLAHWRKQHPRSNSPPAFVSLVLYHGQQSAWKALLRLEEHFGVLRNSRYKAYWLKLLQCYGYALVDLMQYSEEELLALPGPAVVRLTLVLLRYSRSPELVERLPRWQPLFSRVYAAPGGEEDLEALVCYLLQVGKSGVRQVTKGVLCSLMEAQRAEELMSTIGQRLEARGRRKGLIEGEAKGEARGRAKSVLQLLGARGVLVDARSRQRILRCKDLPTLDVWFERALRVSRISELFGDLTH